MSKLDYLKIVKIIVITTMVIVFKRFMAMIGFYYWKTGGGRMTKFIREEPVYEYEFIYNGIKDGQTYENVQWTRQIVGYKDVEYTPLVFPIMIFIGFIFFLLLIIISVSLSKGTEATKI